MRLLWFNLATDANDSALGFTPGWIAAFAKHVDNIDVVTMRIGQYVLPANVQVYSVGKEKDYSESRRAVEFYRIVFSLLRKHHYDACFAHMMPLFVLMAAPLLKLKHIPIVLWYAHKSVTSILQLAAFFSDRIVTSTQEGFRLKNKKVKVIGQGIETDRFLPNFSRSHADKPGTFTILSVGRIAPIKRLELLIQGIKRFSQNHRRHSMGVKIIGEPLTELDRQYAAALQQQVIQEGLQDVVMFSGKIPFGELSTHYQEADCVVNLSPTGAIDKVVLEAMSCGVLPLVANQSFADVFPLELTNICLIEPDAEQLSERLTLFASLPETERRMFGEQLHMRVVRDHSLQRLCTQILAEINDVRQN